MLACEKWRASVWGFVIRLVLLEIALALSVVHGASSAVEAWVRRFSGNPGEVAVAGGLMIDGAGEVYVAGTVGPTNQAAADLILFKFARDGSELWRARFNAGKNERLAGSALDPNGNVVMSGVSTQKIIVVKYDTAGGLLWTQAVANPRPYDYGSTAGLVIDAGENIVTGANGGLVKLDSAGSLLWGTTVDLEGGLVVDAPGNIYGRKFNRVVALDASGRTNWQASPISVRSLAARPGGGVWAGGTTYDQGALAFLSEDGAVRWRREYISGIRRHHSSERGEIVAVRATPTGDLFVTGRAVHVDGYSSEPVTMRLDSEGRRVWVVRFGGWGYDVSAVAVDPERNVYAAGNLRLDLYADHFVTAAYDRLGTCQWEMQYRAETNRYHQIVRIEASARKEVYVLGTVHHAGSATEIVLIKYEQAEIAGGPVIRVSPRSLYLREGATARLEVVAEGDGPLGYEWFRNGQRIPGMPGPVFEWPSIQATDLGHYWVRVTNHLGAVRSADAIVAVLSREEGSAQPNLETTVKNGTATFYSFGQTIVEAEYQWQGNGQSIAGGTQSVLTLTNISPADRGWYSVVTTSPFGSITSAPARLEVFSRVRCEQLVGAPAASFSSRQVKQAVDSAGNVYAAGARPGWDDPADVLLRKLDRDGRLVWERTFEPVDGGQEEAIDVELAEDRLVYILAVSSGPWPIGPRYFLACYSTDGVQFWSQLYRRGSERSFMVPYPNTPTDLALDREGNAYVAGYGGTVKFGKNGLILWAANEIALSIAVDPDGSVSAVGTERVVKYVPLSGEGPVSLAAPLHSRLAPSGQSFQFKAEITNASAFQLQWTHEGDILPGETNVTLALDVLVAADSGTYALEISDGTGLVGRAEARLKVVDAPSIARQPRGGGLVVGGTITLKVAAHSDAPFEYQWRKDGVLIAGATEPDLRLTGVTTADAGRYDCLVSNLAGTVVSDPAFLTVYGNVMQATLARSTEGTGTTSGRLVHLDDAGNLYVAGDIFLGNPEEGLSRVALWKFDGTGAMRWRVFLGDHTTEPQEPTGLEWGSTGNLYVAALSRPIVSKLSVSGELLWQDSVAGGRGFLRPYALALDDAGNIYLAGASAQLTPATVIARYAAADTSFWRRSYLIAGEPGDGGRALVLNQNASGLFVASAAGTLYYSAAGAPVWGKTGFRDDAIALDPAGFPIVAGRSGSAYSVRKYDPGGNPIWESRIEVGTNSPAPVAALEVDGRFNITVAGQAGLIQFDRDGRQLWHRPEIQCLGAVLDADGSIYVNGMAGDEQASTGFRVAKYTPAGQLVWSALPEVSFGSRFGIRPKRPMAVGADGSLYVPGTRDKEMVVLKYTPVPQPPLHLEFASWSSEAVPVFQVRGSAGRIAVIEWSEDLKTWQAGSEPFALQDGHTFRGEPASLSRRRFYRVRTW